MRKLLAVLSVALFPFGALAQEIGLVTIPSKYSVAEAHDRIEGAIKLSDGFQVFARLDFQSLAASQGGKIRPSQLLLFGRGTVLQPLLPQNPVAAIDLPLKILAWEDESGKVMLSYNTGELLAQRHGIKGKDEVLKRITNATASFAKLATE